MRFLRTPLDQKIAIAQLALTIELDRSGYWQKTGLVEVPSLELAKAMAAARPRSHRQYEEIRDALFEIVFPKRGSTA